MSSVVNVSNSTAFSPALTFKYFPASPVKLPGVSDKPTKLEEPPPPPPESTPISHLDVDELYFKTDPFTAPEVSTSPILSIASIAPATEALP